MFPRHGSFLLLTMVLALAGCASERVYRCGPDHGNFLAGRICEDDHPGACQVCGKPPGMCLGHPWNDFKNRFHCKGCGDWYYDEWLCDPPDPCDPCNNCGHFTGQRQCPPSWHKRFLSGLGGRACGCDSCTDTCDSCTSDDCSSCSTGSCGDDSCADGSCGHDEHETWSLPPSEHQPTPAPRSLPAQPRREARPGPADEAPMLTPETRDTVPADQPPGNASTKRTSRPGQPTARNEQPSPRVRTAGYRK